MIVYFYVLPKIHLCTYVVKCYNPLHINYYAQTHSSMISLALASENTVTRYWI